ncbi:MAG: MmgE/PrpD family protein [Myxococcota bacterium]
MRNAADREATRRVAEFVAAVRFEDLPERVIENAKLQILSVLAAALAGSRTPAGAAVLRAVRRRTEAQRGAGCTVIGSREPLPLRQALYANAGFSMALDYDDYLFAGHTGHSAVLGSLAIAESLGQGGREILTAQVAANEIEGRIGASVLLGPLNGQLWSFIHAAGAAVAYARALDLDAEAIESALGIALLQPPHPLQRGFFGSEAKTILASRPAVDGIDAVELAVAGLPGARGILDGDQGFVATLSPRPLVGAFSGLGTTWLTDTLCFKPYPGCAYIDSFVDACLGIARENDLDPGRITQVEIAASVLTVGMDALSRPYLRGTASDPVTVNFSVPYNAAVALLDRELGPRQVSRERIDDPEVWKLAGRVSLRHDPGWSERLQRRSVIALAGGSAEHPEIDLAKADLSDFEMAFGATVTVTLDDGRRLERVQAIPLGAAGRPRAETEALVRAKFTREAAAVLSPEDARRAADLVGGFERCTPAQLRELLTCLRSEP